MLLFRNRVLQGINAYKKVLHKKLGTPAALKKIHELGLIHKQLKKLEDHQLYRQLPLIHCTLKELSANCQQPKYSGNYNGTNDLADYFQQLMQDYQLDPQHNQVVLNQANATNALITALQLVTQQPLSLEQTKLLQQYATTIYRHGEAADQKLFLKALTLYQKPILHNFRQFFNSEEAKTRPQPPQ